KARGIGDHAEGVAQVLKDLTDGHEPDQNLEEPDDGCIMFQVPVDEDNADGVQAHIHDTGNEDEDGKYHPGVHRRIEECRHCHIPHAPLRRPRRKHIPVILYHLFMGMGIPCGGEKYALYVTGALKSSTIWSQATITIR